MSLSRDSILVLYQVFQYILCTVHDEGSAGTRLVGDLGSPYLLTAGTRKIARGEGEEGLSARPKVDTSWSQDQPMALRRKSLEALEQSHHDQLQLMADSARTADRRALRLNQGGNKLKIHLA